MLAFAGTADMARAAPLDFLFGEPPVASRPAYRLRRRPAPPLTRPHSQVPHSQVPQAEVPQAEVPLPVPRPHFASDLPAASSEAESPPATPAPPVVAEQPSPPPVGASAPLPPPKPVELDKPAAAPPKADASKPEAPGDAAQRATEPAKPGPATPPKPPEPTKPEPTKPAVAPSGATTAFTPRAPPDDPQCPSRLQGLQVDVAPITIPPQPDARCTVVQPVRLVGMTLADGAKIAFPEHPTIACTTADAFSAYLRDLLAPLSKGTFGAPLTAVWTGPGLECRSRDSVFGAKLSAHGQGLAIDIATLKLGDGRLVEVGTPKTDAETRFETAARAGACGYFHTVLGPGSDAYHRTHWHFDLEVRGKQGDGKYCK